MQNAVVVQQLSKRYGNKNALQEVTFSVEAGTSFGLLGPNGAGKSTLMKILTGIIDADAGRAEVLGKDIILSKDVLRRKVGYVPQEITLYDKLSAYDNLKFFGELYGVKGKVLKDRIDYVLEQVGLTDRKGDAVATYSGGMKRRINIAAALLHEPQMVFLDEPTVGIDPQSRNHIFEMIRELKKQGVTIIYSTHYMEEVEALCDNIAIIDHGQVIVQGSLQELLDQYAGSAIFIETDEAVDLPDLPGILKKTQKGRGWVLETDHIMPSIQQVSSFLMNHNVSVKSFEIMRPSLEQVFLSLTGTSLRD